MNDGHRVDLDDGRQVMAKKTHVTMMYDISGLFLEIKIRRDITLPFLSAFIGLTVLSPFVHKYYTLNSVLLCNSMTVQMFR